MQVSVRVIGNCQQLQPLRPIRVTFLDASDSVVEKKRASFVRKSPPVCQFVQQSIPRPTKIETNKGISLAERDRARFYPKTAAATITGPVNRDQNPIIGVGRTRGHLIRGY